METRVLDWLKRDTVLHDKRKIRTAGRVMEYDGSGHLRVMTSADIRVADSTMSLYLLWTRWRRTTLH